MPAHLERALPETFAIHKPFNPAEVIIAVMKEISDGSLFSSEIIINCELFSLRVNKTVL